MTLMAHMSTQPCTLNEFLFTKDVCMESVLMQLYLEL